MDEKQAIASSVLTMQSQTRGKAELTLRLLQASDTYTVLGDDSRFVVVSNDDAFDAVIGYATLLSMLLPIVLWHGIFVLHLNP